MVLFPLAWIVGVGMLGAESSIEAFQYADTSSAQRAWVAGERTPPVEVAGEGGLAALQVLAPFAANPSLSRAVIDRQVKLDLAAAGGFNLEVGIDLPEAVRHLSLYFRSGKGWFTSAGSLTKTGWQTVYFSKASFRSEGDPAGWNKIDGIRIAAWRGAPKDASIRIRRLAIVSHDVALVVPVESPADSQSKRKSLLEPAKQVTHFLDDLGLGADAIDEASLSLAALGDRRVAVLPYNPKLGDEAVAVLERFVRDGGRLLVCYNLPARLGESLGFRDAGLVRQERPGQFAQIRLDAADIPGLPKVVRQASWNICVAEPAGHNARVIGRWYDDQGKPTDRAALLLSDKGAFFSQIVLSDDPEAKKQLLAALLGRLSPALWRQMAQSALDGVARVGSLDGFQRIAAHVQAHGNAVAKDRLESAAEIMAAARRQFDRQEYAQAVDLARNGHNLLAEAYLRAQPSRVPEGRGVWNHSGTGAYPGDWERSAKELAAAGFNMILPNMLWAGQARYPSDVLPGSSTYDQYGDQIAQCLAAAKKHGLEVHVWKVNYNLSNASKEFVEELRRQQRTIVSFRGEPQDWLCPSHPENVKLELESMLEVARKYEVDGLHFDYIRYPGADYCYCDGCRQRFEAETGRKAADWPKDCHSGSRREEYRDWRCKQITQLVAAVHRQAKKLRPELKISAAVFGAYPACRESVGQDWVAWVRAGYLDFICPMDYTESDPAFCGLVENQLRLLQGRIPVYPGIGATASRSALSADRVAGQIEHARRLGAAGFTIFNFHLSSAESIIPGIGLGVGSQRAVPPHRSPR